MFWPTNRLKKTFYNVFVVLIFLKFLWKTDQFEINQNHHVQAIWTPEVFLPQGQAKCRNNVVLWKKERNNSIRLRLYKLRLFSPEHFVAALKCKTQTRSNFNYRKRFFLIEKKHYYLSFRRWFFFFLLIACVRWDNWVAV